MGKLSEYTRNPTLRQILALSPNVSSSPTSGGLMYQLWSTIDLSLQPTGADYKD